MDRGKPLRRERSMKTLIFAVMAFAISAQASSSTGKVECASRAAARKIATRSYDELLSSRPSTPPRKAGAVKKGVR